MFKLFGIALLRAHEYGVWQAVGAFLILLFISWLIFRRYQKLLQKDRAAKSLYRTAIFVVAGDDLKQMEFESDEDENDVDYAALLRELDTPANLARELKESEDDGDEATKNNKTRNGKTTSSSSSSSLAAKPSKSFSLRLIEALEHEAVTQFADQLRLHCSVHQQDVRNTTTTSTKPKNKTMDQIAVFDIPENVARTRAIALLSAAVRRQNELLQQTTSSSNNSNNNNSTAAAAEHLYSRLMENHTTSAVPSPASALQSNRTSNLSGSLKSSTPFLRHREAYYATCIDSALAAEEATFNFAAHFAYGMDVGSFVSASKMFGNFFLGDNRYAMSNLRGAHVVVAGGVLSTLPDPVVCRRDLEACGTPFQDLANDWVKGASWSQAESDATLLRRYDELIVLCLRGPERSTTATTGKKSSSHLGGKSGAGGGKSGDDDDDDVVVVEESAARHHQRTSTSSANWNLPSCVSLFHNANGSQDRSKIVVSSSSSSSSSTSTSPSAAPRVVICNTPHLLKYCLPEYACDRDSTVSTRRRQRYRQENIDAIRIALEKHAEDIAVEGFRLGERVRFKRFFLATAKDIATDYLTTAGRFFIGLPPFSWMFFRRGSSKNKTAGEEDDDNNNNSDEMSSLVQQRKSKAKAA